MLKVKNITVRYGKSVALDNVSLSVEENSVVSIVGANGAGKSTILKAVSGLIPLDSGEIWFQDQRIDGSSTVDIAKLGIVQIPEGRWLFPHLSVLANLQLGASLRKNKKEIEDDIQKMFRLFPRLKERCNQKAGTLSGGEQQMVAIARGLMARPKLLLMDEPSLGLAPVIVRQLGEIIKDINKRGVSVLLVEQNVPLAMEVASKGYALQTGKVILEGEIEKIKSSKVIKSAYLGG
ncbi:MAG: ABC transporter ATP-binding protein [Firmicutes bacterium]|jgi:branched-chain amino acid transport system ATP-binding protein|nr:ABC transporter ATP-binding protein [Bacillota bacterium]